MHSLPPFRVHARRNLRRLDLAAATPEHVRVRDRHSDGREVRIDRLFVREHEGLFGPVGDGHDIHICELWPSLAPITVRENMKPPYLATRFDLTSGRYAPVEEGVVPGDA